jgi:hypothetical protein
LDFQDVCQIPIDVTTIFRRLKIEGLHSRVAAKKEFLTAAQKELRLEFATEYGDKDEEWWRSVIFSDEKTFGFVAL